MLLGIGFKVILISTVLLGLLVPARAKLLAPGVTALGTSDGRFARHPVVGLLRPLAGFLDFIVQDHRSESSREEWVASSASILVFIAPLSAFAVVPFGSRYAFGGGSISLVVADIEWGIVWLVGAAMLSLYGSTALIVEPSRRFQHSVLALSYAAGMALSLAALAMVFETLSPIEIAVAQDTSRSIGDFFGPALPALQSLQIPSWGMFLQPVSLVLFVVCALGTPSVLAATSDPSLATRVDGTGQLWLRTAEHLGSLLTASVLVALFAGSGSIPLVDAETITQEIAIYYGTGFATLLVMGIHVSVFFAKVMLVTLMLEPLRKRLAALSFAASLRLCSWGVVPACVVNLWVTGALIVGGGSPS